MLIINSARIKRMPAPSIPAMILPKNKTKVMGNINCGGCVATVTLVLNGLKNIAHWEVDTNNPDKILTVKADEHLKATEIIDTLKQKGYNAIAIA